MLTPHQLAKLAQQQQSATDRALAAAPGVGALAGGVWGLADPKAFNPTDLMPRLVQSPHGVRGRLVSGVLGAGLGASTASLPSAVREAYRALRPSRAAQRDLPKVAGVGEGGSFRQRMSGVPLAQAATVLTDMEQEALRRELSAVLG